MVNTVTVSKVQSPDRLVNQLQDNINNAMQIVGQDINTLVLIGQVILSPLTESQVQKQIGAGWILCDGRSVVRSAYSKLANVTVAPNLTPVNGNSFYLRIN